MILNADQVAFKTNALVSISGTIIDDQCPSGKPV